MLEAGLKYKCMFLSSLSYWLFEVHVMFPKRVSVNTAWEENGSAFKS